jgi:hypothetical protein
MLWFCRESRLLALRVAKYPQTVGGVIGFLQRPLVRFAGISELISIELLKFDAPLLWHPPS